MTRLRNVLQSRAERFRRKSREEKKYYIQSVSQDEETNLTEQCVMPQMEPDGMEPDVGKSDSIYSLEAKDTRATMAESFSSSEHERSQDERREGLPCQTDKQRNSLAGGTEFINLVQETRQTERDGVSRQNYQSATDDDQDNIASKDKFPQPETIEFVDSEDGKVFEISQEDARGNGVLLQNVRSLDETCNDDGSKTLNTNNENLQARYVATSDVDINDHSNSSDRFQQLQVHTEEEEPSVGDLVNEEDTYYDDPPTNQGDSGLYDCDDGEVFYPDEAEGYGGQARGVEEDGTFFEHMRTVQSRNSHINQHLEMVDQGAQSENWKAITQQTYLGQQANAHLYRVNNAPASPQLEDPYQSDGNSSWEEGSFATGASRAVSRVDVAGEEANADGDDAGSYDGTVEGSDYDSDDNTYADYHRDRPFVRLLKKFRDMNADDDLSFDESEDDEAEDDYEDRKRRSKNKRRRRRKPKSTSVLDRLGELGMDILNETIEHAEKQDRASNGEGESPEGGTILNTVADLFSSCGAPAAYY